MMLKEICITPDVFSSCADNYRWKDIKTLLENIKVSGYILGLNNKDWLKEVRQNINKIESHTTRDRLNSIITLLQDRGRIYGHPKSAINPLSEIDWIKIALCLNTIREFHSILATKEFDKNVLSVDKLEEVDINEKFGYLGSKHFLKNEDELSKILITLLSYARKLTIIDPYFYIHEQRYELVLNMIAQSFKERRGARDKGTIVINCKWDEKLEYRLKYWQKILEKIYADFGHIVTIKLWSKKDSGIKMHERYMIADKMGLVVGAGIDKDDYQQSEWSLKDYYDLDEILSQYCENAGVYTLEYTVTMSTIEKNNNE